jgi:hypothetical protein
MPTTTYTDFSASARNIGLRTDNAGGAVNDMSAEEDRLIHAILNAGVFSADAFKVTATGGMNLTVGSGVAKSDIACVVGTVAGQGKYLVRLEPATVGLTVPAADGAQARTDEVYLVVADGPYDAGGVALPRIGFRKGDAGGGAPGPDSSWKAYLLLGRVSVPAGDTNLASPAGQVTDMRSLALLVDEVLPTSLLRNTLADTKGDLFAATAADTIGKLAAGLAQQLLTPDSAAPTGLKWDWPTVPAFADAAARDAAITAPVEGRSYCCLDSDDILYRYIGGTWRKWSSDWQTYTPTFSWTSGGGSLGNGTISGSWRYVDGDAQISFAMTWGSTQTAGGGRMQWSMPAGLVAGDTVSYGAGRVVDSSASDIYPVVVEVVNGSTVMQIINGIRYGSSSSPISPTTSDTFRGEVRVRLA